MNYSHVVLHNAEHDTYTTVSTNSSWYLTLMRSGKYAEIHEGTKKDCDDWIDDNVPVLDKE